MNDDIGITLSTYDTWVKFMNETSKNVVPAPDSTTVRGFTTSTLDFDYEDSYTQQMTNDDGTIDGCDCEQCRVARGGPVKSTKRKSQRKPIRRANHPLTDQFMPDEPKTQPKIPTTKPSSDYGWMLL